MSDGSDATGDPPAGPDGGGRRPYNRPRRYPVPAPPAPGAVAPQAEVTRRNPTLAAAAQEYERRRGATASGVGGEASGIGVGGGGSGGGSGVGGMGIGGSGVSDAAGHHPHPGPGAAHPHPLPHGPGAASYPPPTAPNRTPSARVLLVGAAVLVVLLVVGLVVGLSGGDDSDSSGRAPRSAPAPNVTTAPGATGTTGPGATGTTAPAGPASSGDPTFGAVCRRLSVTPPFVSYVAQLHPAERMPDTYIEPRAGTRVAICVGRFRPGAGAARGRLAYVAEYTALSPTQYALMLKSLLWTLDPALPQTTYRDNRSTTVTFVPQGTALVNVVGTGS